MSTTENSISLKGSADIVTEFFDYGINSIIYQRGLYPAESFSREDKYGLSILITKDNDLKNFISTILNQLKIMQLFFIIVTNSELKVIEICRTINANLLGKKLYRFDICNVLRAWLLTKDVHRLVLVISNFHTKETLERWEFKIQCEGELDSCGKKKSKDVKEIQKEIRNIIRQITASVAFLPLLDTACSFDVLLYTSKDMEVPDEWAESTAHFIPSCEEVRLSNFSTSVHKVDTAVQYRACD